MTDAVLRIDQTTGLYDISLDSNGDIETADFFDTALLYSIYGERRASPEEISALRLRRGWIGNSPDFENGSKIWIYQYSRLTKDVLNSISGAASECLEWMVEDNLAISIRDVVALVSDGWVYLRVTIERTTNEIIQRSYSLWENTGNGTRTP